MPKRPSRLELAKERRIARERFLRARIAERAYQRHLVAVGRHVGAIIAGFITRGRVTDFDAMNRALMDYSRLIQPWAESVAKRMVAEVSERDARAWKALSQSLGANLTQEIQNAPIGAIFGGLMADQVRLITSLPVEASLRVHELTTEAIVSGRRHEEITKEILRSGQVTVNRAKTIARTEVARTASVLTQARAEHVGSDGYIWMTTKDEAVRPEHRKLGGKVFKWSDPPIAAKTGERAHPGCIWNCRCWANPLLPY